MVFSSMTFLWLFLPVTLAGYYLISLTKSQTAKNLWLLLASVFFYSAGEPKYIFLLLLSVLINYGSGLLIAGSESSAGRKGVLALCVVLNLGLLGYFKYYNFMAGLLDAAAGRELLPIKNIVLPIGISFYTFQAMSYVIDLYRG